MKKTLLSMSVFIAAGAYIQYIDDPLNSLASFLIAGSVPNSEMVVGPWPSLGLALLILLAAKRLLQHIRLKMLENTSEQITAEKIAAEFKEANDSTFDKTQRSVIAAPKASTTI